MMALKWILLLVCVALALWPLLVQPKSSSGRKGKSS
jgi:hypothetical protein